MRDRKRTNADQPLPLSEATLGLQVAMRQLQAKFWEEFGSGVVLYCPASKIWFDKPTLFSFEIHQGNTEAIGEIIAEARRS